MLARMCLKNCRGVPPRRIEADIWKTKTLTHGLFYNGLWSTETRLTILIIIQLTNAYRNSSGMRMVCVLCDTLKHLYLTGKNS